MNFMTVGNNKKSGGGITLARLFEGMAVDFPPKYGELKITGIADDSRNVQAGDLFIAVTGHITDGRKFISEASSLGAVAVLTGPGIKIGSEIPIIYSGDIRGDMAIVADRFFNHPSERLTVAGITGTNGKTTTTYMVADIFESTGKRWGKIGTVGCDIAGKFIPSGNTTPGGVNVQRFLAEMVRAKLSGCVMEVSSHALDQGRTLGVRYSSATFTNLTQDHLDYHKDLDSYFQAKARLFADVPVSIVNIDDRFGRRLIKSASGSVVTFGISPEADLKYHSEKMNINGSEIIFEYKGLSEKIFLPLPGIFNQQNAAAAAATAIGLGIPFETAVQGLTKVKPVPGRLQPVDLGQPFAVFVDYAHTPDALEKLLSSLREFGPNSLHIVFGCGGDRDRKKRPLMGRVTTTLADQVYLTSDNPRTEDPSAIIEDALKGVVDKKKCLVIADRPQAIKTAISRLKDGDILVIAGKGHEEYQVVGTVRKYFSDIEVAKSELRKRGYGIDNS